MQFLTNAVLVFEFLVPFLLLLPFAWPWVKGITLTLLLAMHAAFRLFMNIGHFWLASWASLMPFIPSAAWEYFGKVYWREGDHTINLYYDSGCNFCRKTCLILAEFFLPRGVKILPAQDHGEIGALLEREDSWVVTDARGNKWLHWKALVFVTSRSRLLFPVHWMLWIVGKVGIGKHLYGFIGRSPIRAKRALIFLASLPIFEGFTE